MYHLFEKYICTFGHIRHNEQLNYKYTTIYPITVSCGVTLTCNDRVLTAERETLNKRQRQIHITKRRRR